MFVPFDNNREIVDYGITLGDLSPSSTGRFQEQGRVWGRWTKVGGTYTPLPRRHPDKPDSVLLSNGDQVRIVVGDPSGTVTKIQIVAVFGRTGPNPAATQKATPFGSSQCVFLGSYPTMDANSPYVQKLPDGRHGSYYVLHLDEITYSGPRAHWEFMIGAIATTANGTYHFGHDPECDVGMETR